MNTPDKPADKPYVFDKKMTTAGDTHTIEVDTAACYGYFENNTSGTGGGLWFECVQEYNEDAPGKVIGKLTLADYDGVAVLPMKIIKALREAGFVVTEDFE